MITLDSEALAPVKEAILTRMRTEGGSIREGIVDDARDLLDLREIPPQVFWMAIRQLAGEGRIEIESAADFRTIYRLL